MLSQQSRCVNTMPRGDRRTRHEARSTLLTALARHDEPVTCQALADAMNATNGRVYAGLQLLVRDGYARVETRRGKPYYAATGATLPDTPATYRYTRRMTPGTRIVRRALAAGPRGVFDV